MEFNSFNVIEPFVHHRQELWSIQILVGEQGLNVCIGPNNFMSARKIICVSTFSQL